MNSTPLKPHEKLGMLDEHGHRQFIIPAEVKGYFNSWKKKVHFVLLFVFLVLPWITINGHQALLINLPERQFYFFGLHFMAHDTPLAFLLVMIFTAGLALMTALYGRVWCGWACPQTVFIEGVYRLIEIWTEGTYIHRRKLQQASWSLEKVRKTGLKWILYVIVSSLIAHSFLAYWTGSHELLKMMANPPRENWTYFLMILGMTGLLLFNFGWFQEQFCIIMCPYGKFQSVLMDSHSVTVMYDEKRGEPRKNKTQEGPRGDCVSCFRCVQVCPTGIDIRNGIQMECIGCTACIDACDEIMEKVNKPKGLIRYKALTKGPVKWFRARVLAYLGLIAACFIGLVIMLSLRSPVRIEVLRAKDVPYMTRIENGNPLIQNHFKLRLENTRSEKMQIRIGSSQGIALIIPQNPLIIEAQSKIEIPVFLELSPEKLDALGKANVTLTFSDLNQQFELQKNISVIGPLNSGASHERK